MEKNGYGELMARYVGNRWIYIDRNKRGEGILRDGDDSALVRDPETGDEASQATRSIIDRQT
jgi:hypothetical protein